MNDTGAAVMEAVTSDPAPETRAAEVHVGIPTRWSIAGDVIVKATEGLDDFEKDNLRWLGRWAAQRNMSQSEVAAQLFKPSGEAYSGDSVYQTLTGRRSGQGASVRQFAEAVAKLRRRETEAESKLSTGFIETPMTRRLFKLFRRTFTRARLTFVFGRSQVGKTTAAVEYQRQHNHGETIFVRMPTRGTLTHFVGELSDIVRVPHQRTEIDTRRRILDCFDERTLLIVDEAHQCLLGRGESGLATLEFIREIHDRRKCGAVIMATDVLKHALPTNKILRQLWLRRSPGSVLNLPDVVPAADLAAFAQAFGLEPAPDRDMSVKYLAVEGGAEVERTYKANPAALQNLITTQDGLGAWCRLLEDAQELAKERSTAIRWSHVLVSWCLAKAAEEGGGM